MSTRTHLFSLAAIDPIRDSVASRDYALLEVVLALRAEQIRRLYGEDEIGDGGLGRFRRYAEDMILRRRPPRAEPGCWNYVIELLAEHFRLRPDGDLPFEGGCKHYYAWGLYRGAVAGRVGGSAERSLRYLEDGRPLRGARVEHDGCVFAWLGPDEAGELHAELKGLRRAGLAERHLDRFHDGLVKSLRVVARRNAVLFLAAC